MSQAGLKLALAKDDHELLSLCSRVLVIDVSSRPPRGLLSQWQIFA